MPQLRRLPWRPFRAFHPNYFSSFIDICIASTKSPSIALFKALTQYRYCTVDGNLFWVLRSVIVGTPCLEVSYLTTALVAKESGRSYANSVVNKEAVLIISYNSNMPPQRLSEFSLTNSHSKVRGYRYHVTPFRTLEGTTG